MKKSNYIVKFKRSYTDYGTYENEYVRAFSENEAKIIAQAKRIEGGFDYEVESVMRDK